MSSIFWRPLPVMTLTIRQFTGGRAVWVVFALGFIPAIFAAIYLIVGYSTLALDGGGGP